MDQYLPLQYRDTILVMTVLLQRLKKQVHCNTAICDLFVGRDLNLYLCEFANLMCCSEKGGNKNKLQVLAVL